MTDQPWAPGAATGVGSLPLDDPMEAARLVFGELPDLPHVPELPSRGAGADMVGRTASLLVDIAVDLQPAGWRVTDRPGRDHRRAVSFLGQDLDAVEEIGDGYAGPLKVQVTGPLTLAATLERARGDRVLADHGARRDLAQSLAEGVAEHVNEVRRRLPGATVLLQLDEPSLPAVLAGAVPTISGFGRLRSVQQAEAEQALRGVLQAADAYGIVHCCAQGVPLGVLRGAGAQAVSFDLALVEPAEVDAFAEAVDAGLALWVGAVPPSAAHSGHLRRRRDQGVLVLAAARLRRGAGRDTDRRHARMWARRRRPCMGTPGAATRTGGGPEGGRHRAARLTSRPLYLVPVEPALQAMTELKADLVMEGGGVKGIALVGAVSVLEEHGYTFPRIAGTSAGSIVGALMAAGKSAGQLHDIMKATDFRRFQDRSFLDRIPVVGKGVSLLGDQGIYEGKYFKQWLREQLPGDRQAFAGLRLPPDPNSTLAEHERYRLVVMASDVSLRRVVRLPWHYKSVYGLPADKQSVVDAVRASMSIPFFFEPVQLEHARDGDDDDVRRSTLVDGGMLSNFPVEVFDRSDGAAPRWPTFGIKLSSRPDARRIPKVPNGPLSLTLAMIATMTSWYDGMHIDRPEVCARTIFVDTFGISATSFDLTPAQQDRLYESGRAAATRFLASWDFDEYVATYRTPARSEPVVA